MGNLHDLFIAPWNIKSAMSEECPIEVHQSESEEEGEVTHLKLVNEVVDEEIKSPSTSTGASPSTTQQLKSLRPYDLVKGEEKFPTSSGKKKLVVRVPSTSKATWNSRKRKDLELVKPGEEEEVTGKREKELPSKRQNTAGKAELMEEETGELAEDDGLSTDYGEVMREYLYNQHKDEWDRNHIQLYEDQSDDDVDLVMKASRDEMFCPNCYCPSCLALTCMSDLDEDDE